MQPNPSSSSNKPVEVRRGNVTVKVYSTLNKVNGVKYQQPTLVYYDGTKRIRRRFSNWDDAKREAELVATKLANGEGEVLRLTSADRSIYIQALDLLRPFERALNLAIAEYVEALKILPAGFTLKEAASDFARRQKSVRGTRTLPDLVAEYISAKEKAGRSERHLGDLRGRLGRFAKACSMPVAQVTGPLIQSYLDSLKTGNRSRLNELRHIGSLLRFAVRRMYAPRNLLDELEGIERPEARPSETLIFTPNELREMLCAIRPELVPWLAVAAFCGLRTAEILRLDWADVNLQRRFVEIRAINAKTASRRLVPLSDAAVAWLTPHAKPSGRLAHYTEENKFYRALLGDVNRARRETKNETPFIWKRNGLRHSFCSYRLAVTQDAAKVALEAGNSPAMIFRHYRELVQEDEGRAWFSVGPQPPENVVSIPPTEQVG